MEKTAERHLEKHPGNKRHVPGLTAWVILSLALSLHAEAHPASCQSPEAKQFDFWVGHWKLTWGDTMQGTNTIRKELDGCVITENFHDAGQQFTGRSWSLYDTTCQCWKQTWVDNQGAYIALTGRFLNGKMILETAPLNKPGGKSMLKRMIFYNISENQFDWNWESSPDGGTSWQPIWKIHYQRLME